jgi:E3 ubiquitin-protein ligase BAH
MIVDNIDKQLTAFQKKHFPLETRQKKIELETADGIERFGPLYKHPSESRSESTCGVM